MSHGHRMDPRTTNPLAPNVNCAKLRNPTECDTRLGAVVSIPLLTLTTWFSDLCVPVFSSLASNDKENPGTHMLRTNAQASFMVAAAPPWLRSPPLRITGPSPGEGRRADTLPGPWTPACVRSSSPPGEENVPLSPAPGSSVGAARLLLLHHTDWTGGPEHPLSS